MSTIEERTISEVSKDLQIPTFTIRRFCNKGLVPNVRHRAAGRRVFTPDQVDWLRTLLQLHRGGMTMPELKQYVALCRAGNTTIPERKALLETKRRQLWRTIEEAQATIDLIERKIEIFDQVTAGEGELPDEFF